MAEDVPLPTKEKRKNSIPEKQELISQANKDKKLVGDKNTEVLIEKLDRGAMDSFDGETLRLLQEVLRGGNQRKLLASIWPFLEKSIAAVGPKIAGVATGLKGGQWGSEFAASYVEEDLIRRGKDLIAKAILEESDILDESTGLPDLINQWLSNIEQKLSWGGWVTEPLNQAVAKLKELINSLYIMIAQLVNSAIEKGGTIIVEGMANTGSWVAGWAAYPPAVIAGYLGGSFAVGGGLGLAREIKRSAGFEQISEYLDRSKQMVEKGIRNEDGSDPRHELIVLQKRILDDPKRMGHSLSNEEWLLLASAVREARVSILREKTHFQENILLSESEQEAVSNRSLLIEEFIEDQRGMAEADLELAAFILTTFNQRLKKELGPAERAVFDYNSTLEKTKRYSYAFVRGGLNGTGIPILVKVLAKFLNLTARAAIPGIGMIKK